MSRQSIRTSLIVNGDAERPLMEKAPGGPDPGPSANTRVGLKIGEPNIYVAVLVAAFGGLRVHINEGPQGAKILPVAVWLLTIPVFLAQVSALLYLRTDLKFDAPVYQCEGSPAGPKEYDAFLALCLLMVVIVYLTNFKILLVSLQHLVFIMNPLTWAEVNYADASKWLGDDAHHRLQNFVQITAVLPWPFIALLMNIFVNYMVCTDSVSLILSSETPKDAVLNSLAITFIVELDDMWWAVCEKLFHLELEDGFDFQLRSDVWDDDETNGKYGTLTKDRKNTMDVFGPFVERVAWFTSFPFLHACLPKKWALEHSILRVNHGARRTTHLLVLEGLYLIFLRQLLVVLQAVDTNVLPLARDLCTEINWSHGARTSKAWEGFEFFLFVSVTEKLKTLTAQNYTVRIGNESNLTEPFHTESVRMETACEDHWQRMQTSTMWGLVKRHFVVVLSFSLLMFFILGLPTLARDLYGRVIQTSVVPHKEKTDTAESEPGDDKDKVWKESMEQRIKVLEDKLNGHSQDP